MSKSNYFIRWNKGSYEPRWSYQYLDGEHQLIIFELSKIPNFAEPRFLPLGEKLEERRAEIVKRQLNMLRMLHPILENAAISLRLRKMGDHLQIFVIVRIRQEQMNDTNWAERIHNLFPREYTLNRITEQSHPDLWNKATDLSWSRYVDEIIKPEEEYKSNFGYPYFYVASLWKPQANNSLEQLCRTMLRIDGDAAIDLLLCPTVLDGEELEWISNCTRTMRQALSGERVTDDNGRVLRTYDPLPVLKPGVDDYESLLSRYPQTYLFLTSFRVFAEEKPTGLTEALTSSSTRSKPQIISSKLGEDLFTRQVLAGESLNICPDARTRLWMVRPKEELPWRVQRLHRLVDVEEVSSFWRFPIAVQAGFPGFEVDTGLGDGRGSRRDAAPVHIRLGKYSDETGKAGHDAQVNREELAKHGLIVGVPGSGKTTTMLNILHQLWNVAPEKRIPFLVLEPAKTEYRALKQMDAFRDDLLVFTLGEERISPFRFNPFEVPAGISLESHISRLNACFVGAFNLFDPLPLMLDKSIRQTYEVRGWYDDSLGGEPGLEAPTLSDLCTQADLVIRSSGYSEKLRDDFNAALLQRLDSLRRGSKGRMLDTDSVIPPDVLMKSPIVLELDALNEDEKALMMMFILTYVYEHARSTRRSGSPLRHVLVVEEAHNLIGRSDEGSQYRANPKEHAIRLFTRMLAEMRALGQGILICDQLPSALAPEAMKQTNLKVLMRMTAMDDREEMGNTMDLEEAHLKDVVHFTSGQAYVYVEGWDRVRRVQAPNFKKEHNLEEPQTDLEVQDSMHYFEETNPALFMPFEECPEGCNICNRRVRNQAERFVRQVTNRENSFEKKVIPNSTEPLLATACGTFYYHVRAKVIAMKAAGEAVDAVFPYCAYLHVIHFHPEIMNGCKKHSKLCTCQAEGRDSMYQKFLRLSQSISEQEDQNA